MLLTTKQPHDLQDFIQITGLCLSEGLSQIFYGAKLFFHE